MAQFQKALQKTLLFEGGWVSNPDDPGGETYRGISRKSYPEWVGWAMIDSQREALNFPGCLDEIEELQREIAAFYKKHYWEKIKGELIESQAVANYFFDCSVLFGVKRASRMIQMAMMADQKEWDGIVGKKTLLAINKHQESDLICALILIRISRHAWVVSGNKKMKTFLNGWINRAILASGDFGDGIIVLASMI